MAHMAQEFLEDKVTRLDTGAQYVISLAQRSNEGVMMAIANFPLVTPGDVGGAVLLPLLLISCWQEDFVTKEIK